MDIRTNAFFVGNEDSQFISGSNGNIEISSSGFHLQSSGDVSISGSITATDGKIGNWNIIDGKLSGSFITLDADNSTIFKTDQGPGTDDAAAFDQLRDEYYIDFTPTTESPDNFMVNKDGRLIASGAFFEGTISASAGKIGGFTIGSSSLHSGNKLFISGSPLEGNLHDPKYMFISTSKFNLKQSGEFTGSSVRITGDADVGDTARIGLDAWTATGAGPPYARDKQATLHLYQFAADSAAPFVSINQERSTAEASQFGMMIQRTETRDV